jgi:uncharacterized Tic20 family protein
MPGMDPNEIDRLTGEFLDWAIVAAIVFAVAVIVILAGVLLAYGSERKPHEIHTVCLADHCCHGTHVCA